MSSIETGLSDDAISEFVDSQNTDGISVADARKVAAALERVTVIDPACGSGAYLLGMMKELVDLQTTLFNAGADAKSIYDLKLEIIRRNLYGADIDNFAVNIAMLRLWLSLVIEYEGERPEPLPNLEFKIACGDSLLAPDPSPQNYGDLFGDFIRQFDLGRLKAEHMRTTEQADKDRLKAEIEDGRRQIREMLGDAAGDDVMDWRVEFAEVMGDGGFDVIIANPPYVVVKDSMLRSLYKEGVYGRMNLYGLFIQRSVQLLKEKGRLLFINPRTLLTDRYFTNLRKVIKQKSELRGVVLIEDRHNTFARVLQECIILHLARKSAPSRTYPVSTRSVRIPTELNDSRASHSVESGRVLLEEEYDGTFYIGTSEFEYQVFEKMRGFGRKLSTFGIKAETGKVQFSNYREFARDSKGQGSLRLLWAENVQRYGIREARQRKGKEWLSRKMTFNLRPNITGRGVMTQRTTANEQPRRIIATIVEPSLLGAPSVYSENGTNFISFDQLNEIEASPNLLLAALNSSIMEFIFRRLNSNVHVSAGEINKLPFPRMPNESTLREIDKFVTGLLELGGVDCDSSEIAQSITYEHRLDILIGALYGFSPSEVEKIQQALPSFESIYGVDPKPFSTLKGEESEEAISIARRGRRIFVEKIPDMVKKQKYGHFAVIDVYSEDYDIDESHLTATRRLTARRPGVITYTIRIGYPTAYKMGARL